MTDKLRWLLVAGLMALIPVLGVACGDEITYEEKNLCAEVNCGADANVTCDPLDGVCKCGGPGGVACGPDTVCNLEPSPTCTSDLCAFANCSNGQTCDASDGICKCGGTPCGDGEQCVNDRCEVVEACVGVVCGAGESCDPADGFCKCGGAVCSFGESCWNNECVADACAGVNCGPNSVCNPDDGLCHCGDADGPACTSGQACEAVGETFQCVGADLCNPNFCTGGSVCDPADGRCRCGGVGPTFPICGMSQTCEPEPPEGPRCVGGEQCIEADGSPRECGSGMSCDAEDGACRCGLQGPTCGDEQHCLEVRNEMVCANTCDPRPGHSTCAGGESCYKDNHLNSLPSFCAAPGTVGEDQACSTSTDCAAGMHCWGSSTGPVCRRYCDPPEAQQTGFCGPGRYCSGIWESGTIGLCQPN